mmetsp:Transcript_136672/g.354331  ORF Transcript_136672/g.354331 Transcript_136672/m.354331 type:complete len:194 (-) Transcript_136672:170-751(-)
MFNIHARDYKGDAGGSGCGYNGGNGSVGCSVGSGSGGGSGGRGRSGVSGDCTTSDGKRCTADGKRGIAGRKVKAVGGCRLACGFRTLLTPIREAWVEQVYDEGFDSLLVANNSRRPKTMPAVGGDHLLPRQQRSTVLVAAANAPLSRSAHSRGTRRRLSSRSPPEDDGDSGSYGDDIEAMDRILSDLLLPGEA